MTLLQKPNSLSSNSWPWWLQNINLNDTHSDGILFTLTIAILAISWYTMKSAVTEKKKHPPLPPGPRGLPVVGNLLSLDPEIHSFFACLSGTYGPILTLRLGRKVCIVVSSPAAAREVLKDHDIVFANRDVPAVTTAMPYGGRDIVFTPYGPEWRMLRRVCVRDMLGTATLDAVYALRRREIRGTISHLRSRSADSPVNVGEQMFLAALNVITSMLWGGTVTGREREAIAAEFRRVVADVTEQLGKPNLSDFFPGLARFDLQGVARKMREASSKLEGVFGKIIDQRQRMDGLKREKGDEDSSRRECEDFLQVLLRLKEEGDAKTPLTMTHVQALLMDMVVGGTDTTSNTVEFAMAEMMNKPEVMRKAQQELDTVIGNNNVVEESHIPKLPYLHAVMKEVLRLHPILPLMVPHCPSESCVVGGYTIPKGARVFVNVWAIHRDPSIWENPTEFDPERFVDGKGDYSGKDFTYFPFGSGRRICAGIAMAERMVMFSLASLLHSFDWELPAGEKLDLSEKFGIVLKKKVPLIAIPTPRLTDPGLYE
ncbi:Flavonoid 3',5'-hydroxylase [Actinidia chinensis var. chinensis]|uniref:Flavonoid 3',5'-hydroxylase n=1 Tax=Actinidia chinensis var. chinensis TaxID=1590841 RepID=A0A2R6QNJ8_ACTCC|nr:Flavonoid 3',5'-hydroxylase [Actinidia chinensis var. chinensis]